jgi:hypothetical protein
MSTYTFTSTLQRILSVAFMAILVVALSLPASAFASVKASVHIDASSLTTSATKPVITGTASSTKGVIVKIYKKGSTRVLYRSRTIKVVDGHWQATSTKRLAEGTYIVKVFGVQNKNKSLVRETLVIDKSAQDPVALVSSDTGVLAVSSIPLLAGGVGKPGGSTPLSYLQITNTSANTVTLKGFTVKQNGSARTESITALTAIDDRGVVHGLVQGSALFKDKIAFVPALTVFAPGEMRLFTIKGTLASSLTLYNGTELKIDIVSVDILGGKAKGVFPIRGTTWAL